jgi:hypothetical protein
VADAADDVRVANAVEGDRFILKVLDQSPFQIGVEIVLQKYVESLDNDRRLRRLRRSERVFRQKDLSITPTPELLQDVVPSIESATV